jgi:hypothetical protein
MDLARDRLCPEDCQQVTERYRLLRRPHDEAVVVRPREGDT